MALNDTVLRQNSLQEGRAGAPLPDWMVIVNTVKDTIEKLKLECEQMHVPLNVTSIYHSTYHLCSMYHLHVPLNVSLVLNVSLAFTTQCITSSTLSQHLVHPVVDLEKAQATQLKGGDNLFDIQEANPHMCRDFACRF